MKYLLITASWLSFLPVEIDVNVLCAKLLLDNTLRIRLIFLHFNANTVLDVLYIR